jgi:hypothetical protein
MKNSSQIDRKFKEYEIKIQRLKELEKEFQSLDTEGFESEAKALRLKLKDPKKVDEIERGIAMLKEIKETRIYSPVKCENCHKEFDAQLRVCPYCGWEPGTETRIYGTEEDITKEGK